MPMIKKSIEQILSNTSTQVSMLIKDIETNTILYEHNCHLQLVSASTIKVFIMCCAFHEVMNQKLSLNQSIKIHAKDILSDSEVFEQGECSMSLLDLVRWMIISSDNTATNALIRTLGMDKINHYIQCNLQLTQTKLERIMLDYQAIQNGKNNYTSQQDQCMLYEKLFRHQILTPELCELAIEILKAQRCQNQLMRYIPFQLNFAHKTGELDYLIHDCGILTVNQSRYYIGVSLYQCHRKEGDFQLMGQLGKTIIDFLIEA